MSDMIAEGDVVASLKEVFQTPFLDVSVDEDGDIYVSDGLAFPIWIRVDQERRFIKLFTYMRLDDVQKGAEVLSAVNDLNHELVVVRFSLNPKQEAVTVDGDHFISFKGGVSPKTLAVSAQRFASTFKFGFDKLVEALREAAGPDQSGEGEAEEEIETEEGGEKPNLQALAAFLPTLTDPAFKAGEAVSPPSEADGVMEMPYVAYGDTADAFVKAAYAGGLGAERLRLGDVGRRRGGGTATRRSSGPRAGDSRPAGTRCSPSASAKTGSSTEPCSTPSSPA